MIIDKISQIELELTTKCNAKCPQCVRNYYGSYTWPTLPLVDMELEWFKTAIPLDTWMLLEHIKLCGTYGDPMMHPQLLDIIQWIKTVSSADITINTNGGIRSASWWKQLAEILNPSKDKVFFGIDGLADTNHLHRIGVDFNKVIANLTSFNQAGGTSIWSFLIFEHNQHQVELARELAISLKCSNFVCKSTSRFVDKLHNLVDQSPVVDQQGIPIYFLQPTTEPKYKNQGYDEVRNIELTSGYANYLATADISCISKLQKYIYISAEGDVFPCGWLADRMYGFESENHQDHKTLMDLIESVGGRNKINLHYSSLQDIVSGRWFEAIENTWKTNKIQRCAHMCGNRSTLIKHANKELSQTWSGVVNLK